MNPFYNPVFFLKVLRRYLFDIDRLRNMNEEELTKFQDKKLRKIVKYAYTVPLYHDIYKKAKIGPDEIKGTKDIKKLPIVSKEDFKKYYPEGIISSKMKKDKLVEISTSGTTGKSLSIFGDNFDVVLWLFYYIRILREYGISWRKNRLTIIGDFAPHTIGTGYIKKGFLSKMQGGSFLKNMQFLNTNDEPNILIKEINSFSPDFIGGYPGMLGHLALLKQKGHGENINPEYIATIGSVLDKNLKKLIEETFCSNVFEVYGATESGTIAFQCKYGHYHIMSDLVFLEFLKNGEAVKSREPGKLVVTKLYGHGTPIIRYNAINDLVAPLYKKCDCGIEGDLIDRIYGRDDLALYFSKGRILLPVSISEIYSKILYKLKTTMVKDTKIIQHSFNKIEIQLVVDGNGVNVDDVFSLIKKEFQKKVGNDVNITIKRVEKLSKKNPRIVTKVDKSKFEIKEYI